VGPSVPALEVTEVDSGSAADAVSTHGPDAVTIAADDGEVDLDTVNVRTAPPAEVPAGIPVEHEEGSEAS
jgi:hypothetical protein